MFLDTLNTSHTLKNSCTEKFKCLTDDETKRSSLNLVKNLILQRTS